MSRGLIILFFCHFTVDLFTGIWPLYKKLANIDLYEAGIIAMVGGILGNCSQLIFGVFADKGYRKILLLAGILLSSMASFYAIANSNIAYLFLLILTFIGSSMFHPAATGMVGNLTSHRKGFLISLFVAGGGLGLAISQIVYAFVYEHFEKNTLILLILPLVGIVAYFLLPSQAFSSPKEEKGEKQQNMFAAIFQVFKTLKCLYFLMVINAALNIGVIFLIPELMEQLNMGDAMIKGFGHFCFVIGGATFIVITSGLSDRFGYKNIIIASLLVALPIWYLFLNSEIDSLVLKSILFVCLGGALSICNPIGVALGQHLLPKQSSLVSALLMGCAWALGSLGVLLTSFLAKKFNPIFALNILGICMVLNIVIASFLPNIKKSGKTE
ncbi:MAG: hypothetical protein COA79_18625 [Planctomycetota bacterium]|nr:MAG: hypothetical protein COA79_18625 [Planctomycetota bacterium]